MVRNQFRKVIYVGPAEYLYNPLHFSIFMDQGRTGVRRDCPEFSYGTELVNRERDLDLQVWHVNHYGVTVRYKKDGKSAEVTLFGEDVPMPLAGRRPEEEHKSPKDLVEEIILRKATEKEALIKRLEAKSLESRTH